VGRRDGKVAGPPISPAAKAPPTAPLFIQHIERFHIVGRDSEQRGMANDTPNNWWQTSNLVDIYCIPPIGSLPVGLLLRARPLLHKLAFHL